MDKISVSSTGITLNGQEKLVFADIVKIVEGELYDLNGNHVDFTPYLQTAITAAEISAWKTQANEATTASYATADSLVSVTVSNDDGTFTTTELTVNSAKYSQEASAASELNAKLSEDNSKVSEDAAKVSETNSKVSEGNSKTSEDNSKTSETNAKTSEDNAKVSEDNSKLSETNSKTSETNTKLTKWETEAIRLTAYSGTYEPMDTHTKVYTSNDDGTFTETDTEEYSVAHYRQKISELETDTEAVNESLANLGIMVHRNSADIAGIEIIGVND